MPNDSDLSCQSELDLPEGRSRVAIFLCHTHSVAIGTLQKKSGTCLLCLVVGFLSFMTGDPIFFFGVLTLNSSAIKAYSVHRRLGLGSMYSKGCLATGWDAGQAFLHKGDPNGGAYPNCTVHSMQEVGPATTTKVNTFCLS